MSAGSSKTAVSFSMRSGFGWLRRFVHSSNVCGAGEGSSAMPGRRHAPRSTARPVTPSPEARACASAYRMLLEPLVQVALCSVNLRRLTQEYVRTERRARAIENVVVPEIDQALKFLDEQLEILDQEEIARVREHHPDEVR
jgi:hypothetical protein